MNFLSHFYIDRQEPRHMFILGVVTPDLLSIYNPGLRIKSGQMARLGPLADDAQDFVAGLERHFLVDRIFHSSKLFTAETGYLSQRLEQTFPDREIHRKFFIAHILLELQLDQVLVRRYQTIVQEFYAHFEEIRPFVHARRVTEVISGHALPHYESFLEKFLQNRYLTHYREHDHIIYVLGRLLRRVNIEDTRFLGDPLFERLMDDYHARLDGIYRSFFEEIWQAT
jgi:acyl carrier protein phosphodiesterase